MSICIFFELNHNFVLSDSKTDYEFYMLNAFAEDPILRLHETFEINLQDIEGKVSPITC